MNPEKFFIKPEEVEEFTTVYQIMDHARRKYPTKAAYRQMETRTEESSVTFGQFAENVEALRAELWQRGCKDSHIAVLGETSQEWISVYIAVVSGVGVCVPIDKELPPEKKAAAKRLIAIAEQDAFTDRDFYDHIMERSRQCGKSRWRQAAAKAASGKKRSNRNYDK